MHPKGHRIYFYDINVYPNYYQNMKRILSLVIISWVVLSSFAQSDTLHLKFKGVPIDGTQKEYVEKMEQKGFTYIGVEDEVAVLKGDFAAYKGCHVFVSTLKQKDLVCRIAVKFPDCKTWGQLSSDYFSLKEMLTEKYGKPAEETETFQNGEPDNDNDRFHEVRMDRCKYISTFETPKGTIELWIDNGGLFSCYVGLTYTDKINSAIIRNHALDDL